MLKSVTLTILLTGCLLVGTTAAAVDDPDKPSFSFTPLIGGAFWDEDLGLDDSGLFGLRGAAHLTRRLSLEFSYGFSPTFQPFGNYEVDMAVLGADLVVNILPDKRFDPYVLIGWAQTNYDRKDLGRELNLNGGEWGAGVKIRLGGDDANHRNLRLEIRDVMSTLTADFPNEGSMSNTWLVTAGVQFTFGKARKDSDGDGVRDRDDACPDTRARAHVDARGCPLDKDGDGVPDGLDRCDETPAGAKVDVYGCPVDYDGDGVYDGIDECPDTPLSAMIDDKGCPLDGDGDGVYDGLDNCPDTPAGREVDADGCPVVSALALVLLDTGSITTSQIQFMSGSAELDPNHTAALDEIGATLAEWPELQIEIGGHTDSSGRAEYNQRLSEQRAQSVLDYLTANFVGIHTAQYTVVGYGEAYPVADNATPEGRATNRRVEFLVLNQETLQRPADEDR